jgi:hypothetical protein
VKRTRLFELTEAFLEERLSSTERAELLAALDADATTKRAFLDQVRVARSLQSVVAPHGAVWGKIEGLLTSQEGARQAKLADAIDAALGPVRRPPASPHRGPRTKAGWQWPTLAGALAVATALVLVSRATRQTTGERAHGGAEDEPSGEEVAAAHALDRLEAGETGEVTATAGPGPVPGAVPVSPALSAVPLLGAAPGGGASEAGPLGLSRGAQVALHALPPGQPRADEMREVEGEAFAARTDVLWYTSFDPARLPPRLRQSLRPWLVTFADGLEGQGLRVPLEWTKGLGTGGVTGPHASGRAPLKHAALHVFVRTSALAAGALAPGEPEGAPPEDVHLRYHIRTEQALALGMGGVLPGFCAGACRTIRRNDAPDSGWQVRVRWLPDGMLAFEQLPGARLHELRWQRRLQPGVWHAVELRVKLNHPGAADGLVEGWFDGVKVASVPDLRLRELPEHGAQFVALEAFLRPGSNGPPDGDRSATLTLDDVAVARGYIGPRERR